MKISDYKNEDALDLLVDLIDPMTRILSNPEVKQAHDAGVPQAELVKTIIKTNKSDIIFVLATMDGIKVEDANYNVATIIAKLLSLLNDEELMSFF